MSQDFNLNFSEMRHGEASEGTPAESYAGRGNTRNLGIIWPDGRKLFLNYAYLVSGEFKPESNTIVLEFTTHAATIEGQRLQSLFDELFAHLVQYIVCQEERYNVIDEEANAVVNRVEVVRL